MQLDRFIMWAAAAVLGSAGLATAGADYAITWSTIDGGGGIFTAGDYTLRGSIGQPDASGPNAAGDYTLTGGFQVAASASSCDGDTNGDGVVDVNDLNNVILDWGTDGSANGGDLTGPSPGSPPDGIVNVNDLNAVIVGWGMCP